MHRINPKWSLRAHIASRETVAISKAMEEDERFERW